MARKNELTNAVVVAEIMEAGADTRHLRGKSFSISGHMSKKREDIVALIERAGGRFDKSPTWNTTYMITNADWSAATVAPGTSKKLEAARRNGTKVLTEKDFLELLMGEPPKV